MLHALTCSNLCVLVKKTKLSEAFWMSVTYSSFVFIYHITMTKSYWITNNELSWDDASRYCQQRCKSHLASFHSTNDYLSAIEYIQNSFNIDDFGHVWTGLRRISTDLSNFEWSDGSAFDFGNDISGGVYPWLPGDPNNQAGIEHCVHFWPSNNWEWNDTPCNSKHKVLCNSCEGKLNKYIMYGNPPLHFDIADTFCRNDLNTTLASIHSYDDMYSVQAIKYGSTDISWMGLDGRTVSWSWTDNTQYDFLGTMLQKFHQ